MKPGAGPSILDGAPFTKNILLVTVSLALASDSALTNNYNSYGDSAGK